MTAATLINPPFRTASARGFTLIEVMLAMVITAFVALLAYSGLSTAMTAAEGHEAQVELLGTIQLPLTIMERDIRHAVARPIRDEFDDVQGAMSGSEFAQYVLQLTRRGWDNPRDFPRGDLQRVRYLLEDDTLWRESWSVLDRVTEEDSWQRTELLSGVTRMQLSFLNPFSGSASQSPLGGEWVDGWDDRDRLPLAVEVTLELEQLGEVKRVFSIPSSR